MCRRIVHVDTLGPWACRLELFLVAAPTVSQGADDGVRGEAAPEQVLENPAPLGRVEPGRDALPGEDARDCLGIRVWRQRRQRLAGDLRVDTTGRQLAGDTAASPKFQICGSADVRRRGAPVVDEAFGLEPGDDVVGVVGRRLAVDELLTQFSGGVVAAAEEPQGQAAGGHSYTVT